MTHATLISEINALYGTKLGGVCHGYALLCVIKFLNNDTADFGDKSMIGDDLAAREIIAIFQLPDLLGKATLQGYRNQGQWPAIIKEVLYPDDGYEFGDIRLQFDDIDSVMERLKKIEENLETGKVAIILSSFIIHEIFIGYDATSKLWSFGDANQGFKKNLPLLDLMQYVAAGLWGIHGQRMKKSQQIITTIECWKKSSYPGQTTSPLDLIWQLPRETKPELLAQACPLTGHTLLHAHCYYGHQDSARLLIAQRADVNLESKSGVPPLYMACQNGHTNTVSLLLEHKAEVDQTKKDNTPPLFMACHKGYQEIVALLLAHTQQESNHHTLKGMTPLQIADYHRFDEIFDLLEAHDKQIELKQLEQVLQPQPPAIQHNLPPKSQSHQRGPSPAPKSKSCARRA